MTERLPSDEVSKHRKADYPIDPLFLGRWSPRSMSGEEIADEELMSLFEAARWAPSSYNVQPWRFIYAKKGTPSWDPLFNLLVEGNRAWCEKASALVVLASKKTYDNGKPSRTHSFAAGAAWMSLALEGSIRKILIHGMEGFNYDAAREVILLPEDYTIETMFAIGKRAPKEFLPEELVKRESPNGRKPLSELVFEGKFPEPA